jgi:hypothetical protein
MPTVNYILGMNAKLYHGAASGTDTPTAIGTMNEVTNVRDLTASLEAGDADITTRGNSGWRATAPTLRECTIEFEMVWRPSDAIFAAVQAAFLTGAEVELAALDGDKAESDSQGPKGSFGITSFTRKEGLEDAILVSVTAKLSKWDQWLKVA